MTKPGSDQQKRTAAALARRLGVCPACGKELQDPGYGTGSNLDGNFCSLKCIADYWYGGSTQK